MSTQNLCIMSKKAQTIIDENVKYGLTDETKKYLGHTLHRIIALVNISSTIKKGDLGGFVESMDNLSKIGKCWVYDGSYVYGKARIIDDAKIKGKSRVGGNVRISKKTVVQDSVIGSDKVVNYVSINGRQEEDFSILIYDDSVIENSKIVCKNIRISGSTIKSTTIKSKAAATSLIAGSTIENTSITATVTIRNSTIGGNVSISTGNVYIVSSSITGQYTIAGSQTLCGKQLT